MEKKLPLYFFVISLLKNNILSIYLDNKKINVKKNQNFQNIFMVLALDEYFCPWYLCSDHLILIASGQEPFFLVEKDSRLMLIVVEEPSRVIWRRRKPLGGIENQGGI